MTSRMRISAGHRRHRTAALMLLACAAACVPVQPLPAPPPAPAPAAVMVLPENPVISLTSDSSGMQAPEGQRITFTASNANLRDVLPLLANAAGVNLVMGPEVTGKVSVRFQNVLASDALHAVIEQAGLVVGNPAPVAPWVKPVFYDLPVNVNTANATVLKARFGIMQRTADWIVAGRIF